MQIVVRQRSGLGNQLFQYAAGRYLAKKHGASLRIACDLPRARFSRGHARPFLLSQFAISAQVGQLSLLDRFLLSERPALETAARSVRAGLRIQVIRESSQQYFLYRDLQLEHGARFAYVVGYWQTYPIARQVESDLRLELSLVAPLQGKNLEVAERISLARNPVSIHLRRGDYAAIYGPESLLPLDYYERAMKYMRDRYGQCTFFVFSDDVAFAREWVQRDPSFVVVDHNGPASAHEDLRLMSLCHHHVIANSSFSWWGAWLNPRTDKLVIAPSKWLGLETRKIDVAPPEWVLLDV